NRRRTELLVEGDVAALRTKRGLDGVGEGMNPLLERLPCRFIELNYLCHASWSPSCAVCESAPVDESTGNDGQDVFLAEDQQVLIVDLELGARILREDDLVADLDVHREAIAIIIDDFAFANGDDRATLRLLLRRIRQDNTAGC